MPHVCQRMVEWPKDVQWCLHCCRIASTSIKWDILLFAIKKCPYQEQIFEKQRIKNTYIYLEKETQFQQKGILLVILGKSFARHIFVLSSLSVILLHVWFCKKSQTFPRNNVDRTSIKNHRKWKLYFYSHFFESNYSFKAEMCRFYLFFLLLFLLLCFRVTHGFVKATSTNRMTKWEKKKKRDTYTRTYIRGAPCNMRS